MGLIKIVYKLGVQPLLFRFDAETAHEWTIRGIKLASHFPGLLTSAEKHFTVADPRLTVSIRTLTARNPVGLAAGFDKNGHLANALPAFGFGFAELGTFTPLKQEGQKKPRLFRYKDKHALVNRMGFNNPGVVAVADYLKGHPKPAGDFPIGINIGKGKETPLEEAAEDYLTGFDHLNAYADYIVLNVSSPNTPNLRNLQEISSLTEILKRITERNRRTAEKKGEPPKPIFTKVAPDCHEEQLEEIARLAVETNTGLVASNTTIDHASLGRKTTETGGLSGRPLKEKANRVLNRLYKSTKGVVPIIGVGGVFNADDAYEKIRLGASLVQIYSGWVYEGPSLVPEINRGLLKLMERDGFKKIQEAVGTINL